MSAWDHIWLAFVFVVGMIVAIRETGMINRTLR